MERQQVDKGVSLAAGLEAISTCLRLNDNVEEPLAEYYEVLHIMRMKVLKLQDTKKVQQKIWSFFKPLASPSRKREHVQSEELLDDRE